MPEAQRPRLLIPVHSAKRAGAQVVALRQATTLARDYELVVAIGSGPLRDEFAALAALERAPTRLPVWGAPPLRWAIDLARVLPDTIRFALLIRRRRIDAVLIPSTVLVAPALAARLMRVGVLVQAQEAPKSRAARALLRFHGALADLVVAISPMLERALRGARARVVLNYVGVPLPPKPEPRAERRGAAVRLLVIGTIDRHKRQDLAIAAVAELVSQGIDARLELVGLEADAPYAAELHAQVAAEDLGERVTFVGETSDVEPHLLAADALVLPSGEVTPLALMEAMARGTPVVAARVGSVPDVVGQDGVSGLLVPPSDPRALADAIRRLVETPGMAADLARNARARAEELFDERKSHERIERLLAGLLSESAAQKWGPPDAVVGS